METGQSRHIFTAANPFDSGSTFFGSNDLTISDWTIATVSLMCPSNGHIGHQFGNRPRREQGRLIGAQKEINLGVREMTVGNLRGRHGGGVSVQPVDNS